MPALGQLSQGYFCWTFLEVALDRFESPELRDIVRLWEIDLEEVESLKRISAMIQALSCEEAQLKQFTNDDALKLWFDNLIQLLYEAEDILDEYSTEILRLKSEESAHQTQQVRRQPTLFNAECLQGIDRLESDIDKLLLRMGLKYEYQTTHRQQTQQAIKRIGSKVSDINERLKSVAQEGVALGLSQGFGSSRPRLDAAALSLSQGSGSSLPRVFIPRSPSMEFTEGQYSPNYLLDLLNSPIFTKMRLILGTPEEMGLGDITIISSPFLQVLESLEMSLSLLRDEELLKLGVPAKKKCLEHQPLFEGLGHILEHIASFFSRPTTSSQLPLQAQSKEALDIKSLIYGDSVALSNLSLQLETVGKLVRYASSEEMGQMGELEIAEMSEVEESAESKPGKEQVSSIDTKIIEMAEMSEVEEIVESKPGKEQVSSMDTKINEGSTSEAVNTSEVCKSFHNLPPHLKRCVIYTCNLFPGDYEFEEDSLIQLWIAVGFIRTGLEQLAEMGRIYFKKLRKLSIFQMPPIICENYEPTYKVHKDVYEQIQKCFPNEYAIVEEGGPSKISPTTLHSTLLLGDNIRNFDSKIFERFYKAELLRTLKLQNGYGSPIKHVPHVLFVKLRFLRVLDLSSTEIKELPTSVCNLRHLRYLDVSGTRIKKLPESVSKLFNLETLKLRDCSDLVGLPKETSKLINLQYLDLNGVHQLTSIPPRMGQLTNLQTLSIFIVGRQEGFRIEELKCMKKLRGSLCIAKMENVTKDQANEAQLGDNVAIHKLEFQWSSSQSNDETEFNLIEPHPSIEQLKITRYGAESFPYWLSSEKFCRLEVIHLRNCNCTHLPDFGKLPSLKALYIHEMHSLKEISHEFYGAFSKLEVLEIDGMPCLKEWTAIKKDDMPRLRELTIINCPKLVTLPEFMNIKSLQHLKITLCPEIQYFRGERLPENLQSLTITECAKLEERCRKEEGNEWCKIADIPEIWIDYHQILKQKLENSLQTIEECVKLEEQCQKEESSEWCKTASIPEILIDNQQIPKQEFEYIKGTITECVKLEEQCQKEESSEWCKTASVPEISIDNQQIPKQEFEYIKWKEVVLKLDIHDDKSKNKAMKAVSSLRGVDSISMDMKEKKMTVIGDVDPVVIVNKLRKFWHSDIVSVGRREPQKKKEENPKKEGPKKGDGIIEQVEAYKAFNPHVKPFYCVQSAKEDRKLCVIF